MCVSMSKSVSRHITGWGLVNVYECVFVYLCNLCVSCVCVVLYSISSVCAICTTQSVIGPLYVDL